MRRRGRGAVAPMATALLLAAAASTHAAEPCTLYMGPSPIKEAEEHGFGLGIFTGVDLDEGDLIPFDEVLIPFCDSASIDETHPPLREYLWPGTSLPELAVGCSDDRDALWFSPGIAAIAACTSNNFNLHLAGSGIFAGISRRNVVEDEDAPRRTSPKAGSYSYQHRLSFRASRDIRAGEELTIQCNDDDFDGSEVHQWTINQFDGQRFMCLDNVRHGPSFVVGGKGLFARRPVAKWDTILSSPVVPIDRKEMFGDGTGATAPTGINNYQLLLNYALGHEESDLLLLPYGPFVGYINHPPPGKEANAVIRWHQVHPGDKIVSRRQQYHHIMLFEMSAEDVAVTHGKGLMIDIVALEPIEAGDEIYIHYGEAWSKAWEMHESRWHPPADASSYLSADRWFHAHKMDGAPMKTVVELATDPYPDNLQTICYYDNDAQVLRVENGTVYTRWQDDELPHECLRPCNLLERYIGPYPDGGEGWLYTAEMLDFDGSADLPFCELKGGSHISRDLTYDAVLIVDKPYSSDRFLEQAFRHEIGVPHDFYPKKWLRQKVRRRKDASRSNPNAGSEFKKKKVGEPAVPNRMLFMEDKIKLSARGDL